MRRYGRVVAACAVMTICLNPAVALAGASVSKVMPFELAYGVRILHPKQRVEVSRDGKQVAYVVYELTAGGGRILANGVPGFIPNSHIEVSDVATGKQRRIGARAGNCWRPVFSPDGKELASYCDGGGLPRLWIHDLARDFSRQIEAAIVKPQLWVGDEPQCRRKVRNRQSLCIAQERNLLR